MTTPVTSKFAQALTMMSVPDRWRFARIVLSIISMFLASSAFYSFSLEPRIPAEAGVVGDDKARGDLLNMLGWITLYIYSGLILMHSIWTRGLEIRLLFILPFALFIMASSTWAYNAEQSSVFCAMLVANIVVAAGLATHVHPRVLLAALARVVVVCIGISLILLIFYPEIVLSDPERPGLFISGEFSGVFSHKGLMGSNAALAVLVLLFMPDVVSRWERWIGLFICIAALCLANAAGAIVSLGFSVVLIFVVRLLPALRTLLYGAVGILTLIISVILPHIDVGGITELVGRKANLTGRTDFWELAPGYIFDNPWVGYGYGGFFQRDPYSRVWDLWSHSELFFTPNFHNSALDVTIALGVVGLASYLLVLLVAICVYRNRSLGTCSDVLACFIILFTASSATEFQFMRHNSMATILLFYIFFVGSRDYKYGS